MQNSNRSVIRPDHSRSSCTYDRTEIRSLTSAKPIAGGRRRRSGGWAQGPIAAFEFIFLFWEVGSGPSSGL